MRQRVLRVVAPPFFDPPRRLRPRGRGPLAALAAAFVLALLLLAAQRGLAVTS